MKSHNDPIEELAEYSLLRAFKQRLVAPAAPEGYFDTLPDILAAKVMDDLPAGDLGISRSWNFSPPTGYFDQLPDQVLAKTTSERPRIVPFPQRLGAWQRIGLSIAAALALLLAITWLRPDERQQPVWLQGELAADASTVWYDLDTYLLEDAFADLMATDQRPQSELPFPEGDLSSLLQDFSVEELQQLYLN